MSHILGQNKPSLDDLVHFGVKGMKWGVRKDRPEGVSRRTARDARRDAVEFARAKQFFGEGAGTRRKLIKATVEGKSKRDPAYAKAFQVALDQQDTSQHASKARSERKRKDVVKGTAKTARGVRHIINGNSQYASLAAALLVGGFMFARKAGIDKVVTRSAKTAYSAVKNSRNVRAGMSASEFLKNMGIN